MKKLLWLFAAPVLMTACKKDTDNSTVPDTAVLSCLLVDVRDSANNNLKASYEYDASRRVSKISTFSGSQLSGYTTYAYSGNTVELKQFDATGLEIGTGSAVLNAQGFVFYSRGNRQESNNGVPVIRQDSILISYNNASQMLRYTGYYSTLNNGSVSKGDIRTTTYEYASGRLAKKNLSVVIWSNSTLFDSVSTSYTYDDNSPLLSSNPQFGLFQVAGIYLQGQPSSDKMPVKAVETRFNPVSGSVGSSITTYFSATVDSKGNPTRIRFTDDASGSPVSRTSNYSYNCP